MITSNGTQKTGPKDVFLQIAGIIVLYAMAISFGSLLFQYINIYFPDILDSGEGRFAKSSVRWLISVLVIIFPLYIWLSSYIQKELIKNPINRELKIRKWLLYLTLFIVSIVIVIDLISLIYQFLSGGLTIRFGLKIITVLIIALSVFVYYGWNLKKEVPASQNTKMKIFIRTFIVLGSIAILLGFFIAGSPQEERLLRFDEVRVDNLRSTQYQIVDYWQSKGELPKDLENLRDDIRGFIPLKDPETGEDYEYIIEGKNSFKLCAVFNSEYLIDRSIRPQEEYSWSHEKGRYCFSRTIDPDMYPLYKDL